MSEEYDDEAYGEAVALLIDGIDGMLSAGATTQDVREEFSALIQGRES